MIGSKAVVAHVDILGRYRLCGIQQVDIIVKENLLSTLGQKFFFFQSCRLACVHDQLERETFLSGKIRVAPQDELRTSFGEWHVFLVSSVLVS